MATRAELFRYWTERSGPKKPKGRPRPRRDFPVDTSKQGVSATDRRVGPRKPSPKVARKAANRQRTDAQMRMKLRTADQGAAWRGV